LHPKKQLRKESDPELDPDPEPDPSVRRNRCGDPDPDPHENVTDPQLQSSIPSGFDLSKRVSDHGISNLVLYNELF
jgi:hypothetical protein